MVKIRIIPKTLKTAIVAMNNMHDDLETMNERQRETQELCNDEIRNLRCEVETMKVAMDEMRRHINEMQLQLQLQSSCNSTRLDVTLDHSYEKSVSQFGEWVNGLELTGNDLEAMFESKDVMDWASKFIVEDLKKRSAYPHPLCVIKGSRNELLMYNKDAWKKMTDQEFVSLIVNKIFKKLLTVFTVWKNENYSRILTSEHFSTLYHSNYARILSFNENVSKLKIKLFHLL